MMKVTIEQQQATPDVIRTREGTSESGRKWQMRSQKCWMFNPQSTFPKEYEITLPENIPFYPAGDYFLDVESMIEPNNFGSPSISRGAILLKTASSVDSKSADFSKKFTPATA